MVRDEVKHSSYLAFLFDPSQPHGLAVGFLSRCLQKAIQRNPRGGTPTHDDGTWVGEGYMLLFWFEVMETGVRLILEIGPGPREIRQKMLDAANENRPLFDPQSKTVGRKYNRIYRKRLVSAKPLRERNLEGCFDELDQAWAKFLEDDLARMGAYLSTALASHAGR